MSDQPQGQGSPQEPQGSDAPKGVSAEEVNKLVNAAITGRFKAFEKQFETKISEGFTGITSKFEEMLSAKSTEPQADKDRSVKPAPVEESPQFKGMLKKQAELEAKLAKAEQEREAERARGRDATLRQKLAAEYLKHGGDPAKQRIAIGHLVDAEKRARWAEDESVVFRDEDGSDIDLTNGVKSWLKSEEGKMFVPPRGVSGSGDRPVTGQPPGKQQGSMNETEVGLAILESFSAIPIRDR